MEVGDLVKVWTDIGARKPVPLLAKIEEVDGVIFTIRYLSESGTDHIWSWEEDTYEIDDESIAEYLRTDQLEDIGFRSFGEEGQYIKVDTDDDYVPDSAEEEEEDEDDDDDEDEDDEDEDFETENDEEEDLDDSGSEDSLDEE